jgi:hypothetical protein
MGAILQLYAVRAFSGRAGPLRMLKGLLVGFVLMASGLAADAAELVMIRRAGCPHCAAFDREIGPVYAKTDIGKRLPLRHVDIGRPDPAIALASPVRYTPTFVLVEGGREKGRIEGYPGEFFFWGLLEKLLL